MISFIDIYASQNDDDNDDNDDNDAGGHDSDTLIVSKPKKKISKPKMYKVILLNDDFTPMDFVILILVEIFHKTIEQATDIMLKVHNQGSAICGIYPFEVAEVKVFEVLNLAEMHEHPLQCLMEKSE